jgi:5-methylcytosine-specific restriction enzyme subunit McrC
VLDRTNSDWRSLLTLAKLLLGERFQTTSGGFEHGFSLLFEMNTLFEEYVGRMLQRALVGTPYSVRLQGGRLYCLRELDAASGELGAQRFMTKPDILVSVGRHFEFIIDTKWKRLSARIDDPKQGVSQADLYQMMAYGRLYQCPRLMLLYPHHAGLHCDEGVISRHQVIGSDDKLTMATVSLDDLSGVQRALRKLIFAAEPVAAAA